MSVTFDMPTHVNRFPGGWWSASKFVKAMRIIKTIGSTVKRTIVSIGSASSVTWNFSCRMARRSSRKEAIAQPCSVFSCARHASRMLEYQR